MTHSQQPSSGTNLGASSVPPPVSATNAPGGGPVPTNSSSSDMSAYNKLVGMLTINGNLSLGDAPSMAAITAQAKALQVSS